MLEKVKHERNKVSKDLLTAQAELTEARRQILASVSPKTPCEIEASFKILTARSQCSIVASSSVSVFAFMP